MDFLTAVAGSVFVKKCGLLLTNDVFKTSSFADKLEQQQQYLFANVRSRKQRKHL